MWTSSRHNHMQKAVNTFCLGTSLSWDLERDLERSPHPANPHSLSHTAWSHPIPEALFVFFFKNGELKEGSRASQANLEKSPGINRASSRNLSYVIQTSGLPSEFSQTNVRLWKEKSQFFELTRLVNENWPSKGPRKASPKAIPL